MSTPRAASVSRLAPAVLLCSALLPSGAAGQMVFHVDPAVLEVLSTHVDSEAEGEFRDPAAGDPQSAKFSEYRDLRSGFRLRELAITGYDGADSRYLQLRGENVGRQDGRLGLDYGTWGGYGVRVDYNKIPHRFGNDGVFLWNVTSPGRFQIADPTQAAVQAAIERQYAQNPAGVNYTFLRNLLTPFLQAANTIDVGLQRDRTNLTFELGRMASLGWSLVIEHENREGTRPYGGSFGFSNAPEIVEPIDYQTSSAELRGEWRGKSAGAQFGARYSRFGNDVSTLYWDNPFRATNSTDPSAYQSPSASSINGAAVGFADLAPDNEATTLFVNGRAKLGGNWWANGHASYQQLRQDDPLQPYTLSSAITTTSNPAAPFDPTNPANLPQRTADQKVDVTSLVANAGTTFGERWNLAFRFKYYDYDNQANRVNLPGYVRFHAVWEEIERFTAPYSYTRQNLAAELGYELTEGSKLTLSAERRDVERDVAEVLESTEDALRLSYDTRFGANVGLRASFETGKRDVDDYDTERGGGATFPHPESTNQPGLRKFNQGARDYQQWNLQADWSIGERMTLTGQLQGRDEDYDADKGLRESSTNGFGVELGYAISAQSTLFAFVHRDDVDYFVAARQSGAAPSTDPLADWTGDFEDTTDTLGLGWSCVECGKWKANLTARYSETDGDADLFSPPGGIPDVAFPIANYDDVTLWSVDGSLDYEISQRFAAGVSILWEDYDVDSFRTQGLDPFLPGAPLLDLVNGPYQANVFGLHLRIQF